MPQQSSSQRSFFGANASALLDIIRFAAAFAVASTHVVAFAPDWHLLPNFAGNTAVCVFFVLSGFVIRYITTARVTTAGEYWIDRASRIYSVAIPALLLTVLFEGSAEMLRPAMYHNLAFPYHWSSLPTQFAFNLTFVSGFWGYGVQPLSNGVFWSLTFEVVYYVLYGLLVYYMRGRWWLVPLILVVTGPSIAPLFLVWLMGVALYDAYQRLHRHPRALALSGALLALTLATVAALRHPILHFLAITDIDQRHAAGERLVNSFSFGPAIQRLGAVGWFDRLSPSFFLIGGVLSIALLFILTLLDQKLPAIPKAAAAKVRFVADSTFTLYLIHRPFYILFFSFLRIHPHGKLIPFVAMLTVILISISLADPFDQLKIVMRSALRRYFLRKTSVHPVATAS